MTIADPSNRSGSVVSSVEFDVDYSKGADFIVRVGTSATVRLIFKDQMGKVIPDPPPCGKVINDSPATFETTLSADGQSVLIVPKALGSTILRYVYCRCVTANLIVRVTNRVGPFRPYINVRESVLDYLQVLEANYEPRTIEDIVGYVGARRALVEGVLEDLVHDGYIRQSGEFWLPLNPASASSRADLSSRNSR
jgi:hypothetical protein